MTLKARTPQGETYVGTVVGWERENTRNAQPIVRVEHTGDSLLHEGDCAYPLSWTVVEA